MVDALEGAHFKRPKGVLKKCLRFNFMSELEIFGIKCDMGPKPKDHSEFIDFIIARMREARGSLASLLS